MIYGRHLEDNPKLPLGQSLKQPILTDEVVNQLEGRNLMNKQAKKNLLDRKFRTIDYMILYVDAFKNMVKTLEDAMNVFNLTIPANPNRSTDNFVDWVDRGLPILQGDLVYAQNALIKAKAGKASELVSSAANLRGLSKDIDSIGGFGQWWQHIDPLHWDTFWHQLDKTQTIGNNINFTISDYWNDDEILNEEITGPIDDVELLNYLGTNESLTDIS